MYLVKAKGAKCLLVRRSWKVFFSLHCKFLKSEIVKQRNNLYIIRFWMSQIFCSPSYPLVVKNENSNSSYYLVFLCCMWLKCKHQRVYDWWFIGTFFMLVWRSVRMWQRLCPLDCLMLRLAALVLDCLETLYEDIAAQSRIGCSIAKSCPKVKKNLFWSYFEIPGNSNLFAFNKFLIIILSTFGLILHISTQIVQLSCFFQSVLHLISFSEFPGVCFSARMKALLFSLLFVCLSISRII